MITMHDSIDPHASATFAGQPSLDQLSYLDGLPNAARVIGWHYPTDGPLVLVPDGRWLAVRPDGTPRTLVRPLD